MRPVVLAAASALILSLSACSSRTPDLTSDDLGVRVEFSGSQGAGFEGTWTIRDPSGMTTTADLRGTAPQTLVGLATEVQHLAVRRTSPGGTLKVVISQPGKERVVKELAGQEMEYEYGSGPAEANR